MVLAIKIKLRAQSEAEWRKKISYLLSKSSGSVGSSSTIESILSISVFGFAFELQHHFLPCHNEIFFNFPPFSSSSILMACTFSNTADLHNDSLRTNSSYFWEGGNKAIPAFAIEEPVRRLSRWRYSLDHHSQILNKLKTRGNIVPWPSKPSWYGTSLPCGRLGFASRPE